MIQRGVVVVFQLVVVTLVEILSVTVEAEKIVSFAQRIAELALRNAAILFAKPARPARIVRGIAAPVPFVEIRFVNFLKITPVVQWIAPHPNLDNLNI